uniref:Late embryogenesis abundant protein LEA-2 subgroup domain-containing protein n=1 Tax=Oryza brachyantha TaxID=4533 RepID=J3MAT3_ORYBR
MEAAEEGGGVSSSSVAAEQGGGGGGVSSAAGRTALLGWINAARYVAGLALMVLIVVMVAYAIKVVVRERQLVFTVADVRTERYYFPEEPTPASRLLRFVLSLRASNPSDRTAVYYTGHVQAILLVKIMPNTTVTVTFPIDDMVVGPKGSVAREATAELPSNTTPLTIPPAAISWDTLVNSTTTTIYDAVLQLQGNLTSEKISGENATVFRVVYTCTPVTVRGRQDYEDYEYDYDDAAAYNYGPPCLQTRIHL